VQSGIALASARAGNVIGGGDWAQDRLIPDMLAAFEQNKPVIIRNPMATRPWQHVLEPLSGYLSLAERLFTDGQSFAQGWNFGPNSDDVRSVEWIVARLIANWNVGGGAASWELDTNPHPHEAGYLQLDIAKAKHQLKWQPHWDLNTALEKIVEWHKSWLAHDDAKQLCLNQIAAFSNKN
jgi:CDP-glucose 4,6-dehydratase